VEVLNAEIKPGLIMLTALDRNRVTAVAVGGSAAARIPGPSSSPQPHHDDPYNVRTPPERGLATPAYSPHSLNHCRKEPGYREPGLAIA